jgi:hypothetical protein
LAKLTKDRSALLDKLVSDCIKYGLNVDESMEYIRRQYGEIKKRAFFRRKRKLQSDESAMQWLSNFTRIGFVELHRKITEDLSMILEDSLRRLYDEKQKPAKERDDHLILKLKKDIKESSLMLSEFSAGSPVIAGLKAKLDRYQHGDGAHGVDYHYGKTYV